MPRQTLSLWRAMTADNRVFEFYEYSKAGAKRRAQELTFYRVPITAVWAVRSAE